MAYCGPRSIPLSVFLGRVVRPGVDPEWLPEDRAAALDWAAYEARRCPSCRIHPDEWDGDPEVMHAHLEQCPGCKAQRRATEQPEAEGPGVYAVMARGPAMGCPQCAPLDDDN